MLVLAHGVGASGGVDPLPSFPVLWHGLSEPPGGGCGGAEAWTSMHDVRAALPLAQGS